MSHLRKFLVVFCLRNEESFETRFEIFHFKISFIQFASIDIFKSKTICKTNTSTHKDNEHKIYRRNI